MDPSADIGRVIEDMGNGELLDTLFAALNEVLGDQPNQPNQPPPPPPPLPPVTAGLELNPQPQPLESQGAYYGACIPTGADPRMFEQQHPVMAAPNMYSGSLHQAHNMQPAHLHGQTGAYSQGQYLPSQWPVNNVLTAPAVSHPAAPAAPQQTVNKLPVLTLTGGQGLRCIGMLNGEMMYEVTNADFTPPVSRASHPLMTSESKKRKLEDDQQYVKKPPNAFMLFLREQKSTAEVKINFKGKGTAAINTFLGQRWTSLTAEQQAKYYEQAAKERRLHTELHPDWSTKENYGKKKMRVRRKDPSRAEASASKLQEDTQQTKTLCVTPVQTALMESSSSQAALMESPSRQTGIHEVLVLEAPNMQTVKVQLPHTQTAVTVPMCDMCWLPQVHDISPASWLDSPETASTLASPAAPTQTQTESTNSEDVRGRVSLSYEQLEPLSFPAQPELPSFPHMDIYTVNLDQLNH